MENKFRCFGYVHLVASGRNFVSKYFDVFSSTFLNVLLPFGFLVMR